MNNIAEKNLLVVGAGGIGCELLKNLVMTGFKNISIVDLDKVEKSNLNRQFLYNYDSIGKYKSEMAKQSIEKTRNDLNLKSYVGNIKNLLMFDHEFFKQFDLILNALDNIDARTYINKICNDFNIALVNSGTEGFLGTVSCHIKGITPCYNCIPRTNSKKFPICSIRSKPEKIEHCVAWAKALFELVYCQNSNGNLLEDYNIDTIDHSAFEKLFSKEISEIKDAKPINEVPLEELDYDEFNRNLHLNDDKTDYTIGYLTNLLFKSAATLVKHSNDKFDKENKNIVNFVFSAANLRAYNFNITLQSRFKIKEIAGNIIPAIASTNSIIAAIQTLEAVKILQAKTNYKNVSIDKSGKIISILSSSEEINKQCIVCSDNKQMNSIEINFENFTIFDFIYLLKAEFNVSGFMITLDKKEVIYEDEEADDYDTSKTFLDLVKELICRIQVSAEDNKLEFLLKNNNEMIEKGYKLDKISTKSSKHEVVEEEKENIYNNETYILNDSDDDDIIIIEKECEPLVEDINFLKQKRKNGSIIQDLPITNKKMKL